MTSQACDAMTQNEPESISQSFIYLTVGRHNFLSIDSVCFSKSRTVSPQRLFGHQRAEGLDDKPAPEAIWQGRGCLLGYAAYFSRYNVF
jgi:hypothetical protein